MGTRKKKGRFNWVMKERDRVYVMAAIFTALVALLTMAFTIPIPATRGYINLGDAMIFTTALILGKKVGFLAGGIGSALADLLLGYAQWAPFTLIIKGLEGFIAGLLGHHAFIKRDRKVLKPLGALILAGLWMVAGYFLAGSYIYGYKVAFLEVPGNIFQATGSIIIAIPLSLALKKSGMIKGI